MKHPILWGAAATAALSIAGAVASAALDKWANETLSGVAWCARCGRACLHGAYETRAGWLCHDCGADMPEEFWTEE